MNRETGKNGRRRRRRRRKEAGRQSKRVTRGEGGKTRGIKNERAVSNMKRRERG